MLLFHAVCNKLLYKHPVTHDTRLRNAGEVMKTVILSTRHDNKHCRYRLCAAAFSLLEETMVSVNQGLILCPKWSKV